MVFALFIFILGTVVGSFLNVLIDRLPKDEKISGRSHCDKCLKILAWYDLIPILSFLILRGRCRYCKTKISFQYPLIEFTTGILFIFVFWILDWPNHPKPNGFDLDFGFWILDLINLVYLLTIISLLIVIFFSDLKYYIIPDKIIYAAIGIAIAYNLIRDLIENCSLFTVHCSLISGLLAAFLAGSFFLLLFLASRGTWLGFGDVKLAVFMGLLLGWPNILPALFMSFLIGAIIGVILIVFHKKGLKSQVPFGPFLVVGTFIALFWGNKIADWYMNLFLF